MKHSTREQANTYAIQDIAKHFNHFLESKTDSGLMLCDGRAPQPRRSGLTLDLHPQAQAIRR